MAEPRLYSLNFRVDERLFELWAAARGFNCKNGSHFPGVIYHHALVELLGDRAPQVFATVRHRNFGLSIAFYSRFDLDALRRPTRGRGTADIENSMKFKRVYCTLAPEFAIGERIAFLIRMRPYPALESPATMHRAAASDGEFVAKRDQGALAIACHRRLASRLSDCGTIVSSELVEFEYALVCDDGVRCEKPSRWTPSLQLRCEMDVTDPARLNELLLSGIEGSRDHGFGMLRISVEWRRPIVSNA